MQISDRGYLQSANVPPSSPPDQMLYWNVSITPESIQFQPTTTDPCGTGQRFLVLGVETQLPLIPQKLQATLGFAPSGNLVNVASNVIGCDSRFAVPGQLNVQGPGSSYYTLSTCTEGYFNNYSTPGAPPIGFYNLAGKFRVPFFEDVRVHLHVGILGSNMPQVSIMGGWPDPTTDVASVGWNEISGNTTNNYFNTTKFDPGAAGFPQDQGVTINDYEQSSTTQYHPVAQRNWIQVATFDYPLLWNSSSRCFTNFQTAPVSLPVVDVESDLKELSPGKVDLDFDQDVTLQLPVIKVLESGERCDRGDRWPAAKSLERGPERFGFRL